MVFNRTMLKPGHGVTFATEPCALRTAGSSPASFPLSIREEGTKDHASHADHRGGAIAVAVPPGVRPHRSPLGPSAPGTLLMSDSPPVDVTNPQLDEAEIAALAAYGTR